MALTQYNATGKTFDLTKGITMISPDDTPLMSLFGRAEPATQVIHSWEEEELGDPKDNAQIEGFTYVPEEPGDTSLKDNVCQIFSRGYKVTDTNQAIKRYNVKDYLARKMQQAMKLLALDVEKAITTNTKKISGNATTARKMAGLQYYVKTNVSTAVSARALTYDLLNDMFENIYKCGGNPDVVAVSPRNKRIISLLLPLSTERSQPAGQKKLVQTIDVIEGDFGRKRIVTDRWIDNEKAYVLSTDYCKLSYLRPFKTVDLPKTADQVAKQITGELTLEVRAEKASGIIDKLNGTLPVAAE